jgi:hypothetical protein
MLAEISDLAKSKKPRQAISLARFGFAARAD